MRASVSRFFMGRPRLEWHFCYSSAREHKSNVAMDE
jgi:hypothetical protein